MRHHQKHKNESELLNCYREPWRNSCVRSVARCGYRSRRLSNLGARSMLMEVTDWVSMGQVSRRIPNWSMPCRYSNILQQDLISIL